MMVPYSGVKKGGRWYAECVSGMCKVDQVNCGCVVSDKHVFQMVCNMTLQ